MANEWLQLTASELGQKIGFGEVNPEELTESYLSAIRDCAASPRIYARLTEDRARIEAAASAKRARQGLRLSKLDGVPVSWTDLFDTAGVETNAGSALLSGRTPEFDAQVVRNASAAGMVCLGKTHMSELAFSGLGMNPITATPPCVNYPESVPGGSSSGAAASVAFRLAPCAIGSDTGGSVRIPAAWNDLVGLKTTSGLLSLEGVVPLCSSFDTVGPLVRSVEDAAALLSVLGGVPKPDLSGANLRGVRLLALQNIVLDELTSAPLDGYERALRALEIDGANIIKIEIPELEEAFELAACLYCVEAYATWKNEIESSPGLMFDKIRERFQWGAKFSGTEFSAAWSKLRQIRDSYRKAVSGSDGVVLPTSPNLPPDMRRLMTQAGYFESENLLALRNTRIANLMEVPALTIPTPVPSTGIMFLGAPFQEGRLLRLGKAVEAALDSSRDD